MEDFGEIAKNAFKPAEAPDSLVARYGLVTLKGIGNLPQGIAHAAIEDLTHPVQTAGLLIGSAAIGAFVKTVLPKTGNYGKIAGLAIGSYLTYRALEPAFDAYSIAGQAKYMDEIDVAGKLLGNVGGSLVFNSALAGAAYKLGGMGAERLAVNTRFEVAPAPRVPQPRTWPYVMASRLPAVLSVSTAGSTGMSFDPQLAGLQKFAASEQAVPDADFKGMIDGKTQLEITVQLKSKASDHEMEETLRKIALGELPPLSDKEFSEKFGASDESVKELEKFAKAYGLTVSNLDMRSGRVVLKGSAEAFSEAFKTKLMQFDQNGEDIRARYGSLFVPKTVAKNIEGVFGLDNRPQAKPRISDPATAPRNPADQRSELSYRPDEVANAYNFPKGTTGRGQSAAIIELGGGMQMENEEAYYKQYGLKMPEIKILEISGGKNSPGSDYRADKEVSLDSQILGSVAPDAKQLIIFSKNSEQGFIDAIDRAAFPQQHENNHQAISISWGQPLKDWTEQGKRGMSLALKKAALRGISVFAASGDDGATNGVPGGKYHVDYPAADPYVTGAGGTKLTLQDGKIVSEVVWNDKHGATGGGISPDAKPDFQKDLSASNLKLLGRAVPDLAGNASSSTGYKIRVRGADEIGGGTSAVAPLYAALALRLNEALGGQKTVGFMNPFLYKHGLSGKAEFFNDITEGNNNGYHAGRGWDAVSGWGSLDGEKLLLAYKTEFARIEQEKKRAQ